MLRFKLDTSLTRHINLLPVCCSVYDRSRFCLEFHRFCMENHDLPPVVLAIKQGMDFEVFGRVLKAWKSEDY